MKLPEVRELLRASRGYLRDTVKWLAGQRVLVAPLGSTTLDSDDIRLVNEWLERPSEWQKTSVVDAYHRAFASWNGSKYAYSFMGGRVALSAIVEALELEHGDDVLLPGYTCVVVPNSLEYAGVRPVYCDIELDTFGLDVKHLEARLTPNTRAVILHHLYGLVCRDYEAIIEFARQHDLWVIEDCAHATGAEFRGKKVGTWGDVAFYSSEQSKVFTTGQGGMAVTDNDEIASRLAAYHQRAPYPAFERVENLLYTLKLRYFENNHPHRAIVRHWARYRWGAQALVSTSDEEIQGNRPTHYGQKMPAPLAAVGLNQLAKIDGYNSRRCKTAARWAQWCDEQGYSQPVVQEDSTPVFLRYPVMVEPARKQDRSWGPRELGVQVGQWFVSPIHPVDTTLVNCPNAAVAVSRCINFPGLIR
jgi:dTDP-4-amino-4,6-dideoxygalactose transaminase